MGRDEEIRHVVVIGARALEPLDVPPVGEGDLLVGDDRHEERWDPIRAELHLSVHRRDEPGRHVLGVGGARAEVPGSGQVVATLDRGAKPIGEELATHR